MVLASCNASIDSENEPVEVASHVCASVTVRGTSSQGRIETVPWRILIIGSALKGWVVYLADRPVEEASRLRVCLGRVLSHCVNGPL